MNFTESREAAQLRAQAADMEADVRRTFYADALLVLIRAGEIVHGQGKTAMAVLGLTMPDMEAARTRADKEPDNAEPPIPPPNPAPPAPEPPRPPSGAPERIVPDPQRYHPRATRRRPVDDDGNLFCTRHDNGEGAWLPPECFALRSDYGKGARRSACRDCMDAYNRRRYLSVSQAVQGNIIVRFEQSDGDPIVTCGICTKEIATGERVYGATIPLHDDCRKGVDHG